MERVFTKDVGSKFQAGEVRDFPHGTWEQLSQNMGKPLTDFTMTTVEAARQSVVVSAQQPAGIGARRKLKGA